MNINDYYLNDSKKNIYENNTISNTYENSNIKNAFLLDLKNILLKKGIKGLLNLHWKFLVYCSNVSKITLNDFINLGYEGSLKRRSLTGLLTFPVLVSGMSKINLLI